VNKLITVYWRDIPAQVIGRSGRKTSFKKMLDPRFQHAIDRAAMRAGRGSSDHYLADWRRESQTCEGDLERAVDEAVARLEGEWSAERLDRVARKGGVAQSADGAAESVAASVEPGAE
jgi:hypothetical protein